VCFFNIEFFGAEAEEVKSLDVDESIMAAASHELAQSTAVEMLEGFDAVNKRKERSPSPSPKKGRNKKKKRKEDGGLLMADGSSPLKSPDDIKTYKGMYYPQRFGCNQLQSRIFTMVMTSNCMMQKFTKEIVPLLSLGIR